MTAPAPVPPPAGVAPRSRGARAVVAVLAAAALLLARCANAPPVPAAPHRIVACGQPIAIDAHVVTWQDEGGYDAYRTEKRFTKEPVPDGKLRYRKVRSDLPAAIAERVQQHGWQIDDLQQVVHLFVLHFDVAGTSRQCFKVLQDLRNLSVHFLLDVDGTIYQTLDVQEHAQHATIANAISVGVEIAHPGCFPQPMNAAMLRWYERDAGGWRMKFPAFLSEPGIRTAGFVPRPDRPEPIEGTIHGTTYWQLDYTREQYQSLAQLCAALHRVFPRIRLEVPRDDSGAIVTTNLPAEELLAFDGIVGHFHVQRNKQDPGPAFQWERLLREARALVAVDAAPAQRTAESSPPSTDMQQGPMMPR